MSDKVFYYISKLVSENIQNTNQLPWFNPSFGSPESIQRGFVSNKPFSSINSIITSMMNSPSPFWLSFIQARESGLYLKPEQKYTPIVEWNVKEDAQTGKVFYLKCSYSGFYNLSQFKNWEDVNTPTLRIRLPEQFDNFKNAAEVVYGSSKSFYSVEDDKIYVPEKNRFESEYHFYRTLFILMIKSTSVETRLNWNTFYKNVKTGVNLDFSDLVSEIGSCYLCNHFGIKNENVGDVELWLNVIKNDVGILPKVAHCFWNAKSYILAGGEV